MEELELTDPVVVPEIVTNKYRMISLYLDRETPVNPVTNTVGLVVVKVSDNNNQVINCQYEGSLAIDMIKFLNTGNFSTTSMQKRILQRLTTDGKLPPGTVTGAPDV